VQELVENNHRDDRSSFTHRCVSDRHWRFRNCWGKDEAKRQGQPSWQWWKENAILGLKLETLKAVLNARYLANPALDFFDFGKRVDRQVADIAALKGYVKSVHASFEIGDSRFLPGEAKPTPQDVIATSIGAELQVLGPSMDPSRVDIETVMLKLIKNGEVIQEASAENVLGNPWNALLRLANSITKRGGTLEPGMVIYTGKACPAYKATGDTIKGRYVGDCGQLGTVTVSID